MNFKRILTARPGRDLKTYYAYHVTSGRDKRGNVVETMSEKPFLVFSGVISKASQKEQEHFSQLGHRVTHEVIAYKRLPIIAGDVLVLGDRKFFVHAIRDPGEIGLMFCLFTEERMEEGHFQKDY